MDRLNTNLPSQPRVLRARLPRPQTRPQLHRRLPLPLQALALAISPRPRQRPWRRRRRPGRQKAHRAPQDHHHLPPLRKGRTHCQNKHILCRRRGRMRLFLRRPLAPRLRRRRGRSPSARPGRRLRCHYTDRGPRVPGGWMGLPAHRHAPAGVETVAQLCALGRDLGFPERKSSSRARHRLGKG